jgi:YVTN family beta-propeller protein
MPREEDSSGVAAIVDRADWDESPYQASAIASRATRKWALLSKASEVYLAAMRLILSALATVLWLSFAPACPGAAQASDQAYFVCVSNERSGDVTIIEGKTRQVAATIPVGKRPRGIHASPDGSTVYVALSGRPIEGPPQLDAQGNPILRKHDEDDDDDKNSDHSADGIGVVDLPTRKFLRKLPAGSDPEQFTVNRDGTKLYVANEDVATASELSVRDGKVLHIFRVGKEPEGMGLTPDGSRVYVTCETTGEVYAFDTGTHKSAGTVRVGGRPRSVVFLADGSRAFVPSESSGMVHMIDTAALKEIKTLRLPTGFRPMGTALSPDGTKLYLGCGRSGMVCVVDTAKLEVIDAIKAGARPWGVAVSPDGKLLFVANGPSNDVSMIDLENNKEIGRIKAGQGPWGVTVVPRIGE